MYELMINSTIKQESLLNADGVCATTQFVTIFGKTSTVLLTNAVMWERQLAVCDPFRVHIVCSAGKAYKVFIHLNSFLR